MKYHLHRILIYINMKGEAELNDIIDHFKIKNGIKMGTFIADLMVLDKKMNLIKFRRDDTKTFFSLTPSGKEEVS